MLIQVKQVIHQARPLFLQGMGEAVFDALRSDKFLYGENVIKFEEEFANFASAKYVATGSGSEGKA